MLYRNIYAFVTALLTILITLLIGAREVRYGGIRIEMRIEQIQPASSPHIPTSTKE
jgi:hypothetical protein